MFGLKRLFRREIRKVVKTIVSAPENSAPVCKNTPVVSSQTVTQVSVTKTTVSVVDTQQIISGKCHVIDGDTIAIGKQKIRLAGIDAPELNKPYGKKAWWASVELCKGQNITAKLTGETSYDRVVAKCLLDDGSDLAVEMVKLELALDIPHFPDADYKHLETPSARRKLRWRPKSK